MALSVYIVIFLTVGRHDPKDSPAVPPHSGQRVMGGRNEPGPQLHHLLLDVLPAS